MRTVETIVFDYNIKYRLLRKNEEWIFYIAKNITSSCLERAINSLGFYRGFSFVDHGPIFGQSWDDYFKGMPRSERDASLCFDNKDFLEIENE